MKDAMQQYVGKIVSVKKEKQILPATDYRPAREYNTYHVDHDDPVITEIMHRCVEDAWHIRIWLPNSLGTCDYSPGRLNVYIEETTENVFTITGLRWG